MPRTGTGPFPARRSSFPIPAGQYGFMARDTQFSSAPYGGSYGSPRASPYGPPVPGRYYRAIAGPARGGAAQDYAPRAAPAQQDTGPNRRAQDDAARADQTQGDRAQGDRAQD